MQGYPQAKVPVGVGEEHLLEMTPRSIRLVVDSQDSTRHRGIVASCYRAIAVDHTELCNVPESRVSHV